MRIVYFDPNVLQISRSLPTHLEWFYRGFLLHSLHGNFLMLSSQSPGDRSPNLKSALMLGQPSRIKANELRLKDNMMISRQVVLAHGT